jgi:hypothetical protein
VEIEKYEVHVRREPLGRFRARSRLDEVVPLAAEAIP